MGAPRQGWEVKNKVKRRPSVGMREQEGGEGRAGHSSVEGYKSEHLDGV